jgi:hypothetical protein
LEPKENIYHDYDRTLKENLVEKMENFIAKNCEHQNPTFGVFNARTKHKCCGALPLQISRAILMVDLPVCRYLDIH